MVQQASYSYIDTIQISTASISCVVSLAMAIMIKSTAQKLSTPFRRIIVGISLSDVLQSLAMITGPFVLDSVSACDFNGFIMVFGSLAVPLYTAFLCVYYFCKLNRKMSNLAFCQKIEKKGHLLILTCLLSLCIYALVTANLNPLSGVSFCYFDSYPRSCEYIPEIVGECLRGKQKLPLLIIALGILLVSFAVIIVTMVLLIGRAVFIERTFRSRPLPTVSLRTRVLLSTQSLRSNKSASKRDQNSNPSTSPSTSYTTSAEVNIAEVNIAEVNTAEVNTIEEKVDLDLDTNQEDEENNHQESVTDQIITIYRRETVIQGSLYILVFFLSYSFPFIDAVAGAAQYRLPHFFTVLTAFFYPLGGLFNILVYTRPKVHRLRDRHPEFSYMKGLIYVLKAGGEVPTESDITLSVSKVICTFLKRCLYIMSCCCCFRSSFETNMIIDTDGGGGGTTARKRNQRQHREENIEQDPVPPRFRNREHVDLSIVNLPGTSSYLFK
mmetsp:Transcript_15117/g.18426  ORF Transcript_15117/g.18426 Transcript_15117/m.18426 type:complete len:496 (-) Transcript_15117:122-1609(-)